MPPKPGPKRVAGPKKVGGSKGVGTRAGSAKGAGARAGGARTGGSRAGPLAVSVRNHLTDSRSITNLVKPVSSQIGNEHVRHEYRRNSGNKHGTSATAMSALGQDKSTTNRIGLTAHSAATNGMCAMNKSMTNIFQMSSSGHERPRSSTLNLAPSQSDLSGRRSPSHVDLLTRRSPSRMSIAENQSPNQSYHSAKRAPSQINVSRNLDPDQKHSSERPSVSCEMSSAERFRAADEEKSSSHEDKRTRSTNKRVNTLLEVGDMLGASLMGSRNKLNRSVCMLNLTDKDNDHTKMHTSKSSMDLSPVEKRKFFIPSFGKLLSPIVSVNSLQSYRKPEDEDSNKLQNTLGGNALTSATPTALSSHVDPRMLHAAAGMAGMGFVATAASATNEDGDDVAGTPGEENPEFTQVEIDGEEPAGNGYSETMAPPPAPSELMRVTQIGENHPYPEESYQTQPLLSNTDNTELGYHSQSKHIPLENMTTLPPMQHQTTNFSFNNKPYTDNYLNTVQYYDTSTSDGMYCYSCIMFLGVLCIGIGIVLVIVEIFGLFGQTKYLAYSGGGVLFLGITTLASSMFAWRRHRSQIKKKLAHV